MSSRPLSRGKINCSKLNPIFPYTFRIDKSLNNHKLLLENLNGLLYSAATATFMWKKPITCYVGYNIGFGGSALCVFSTWLVILYKQHDEP